MWRKEDGNPNPKASSEVSSQSSGTISPSKPGFTPLSSTTPSAGHNAAACVSQGIKIKGEVVGTEDLFIDGVIEGKITIANSSVTVGPNGTVKADITAREIVLRGKAEGKFIAEERIQIWNTARVQGELKAERISIEDGAELRGRVEAGKAIKATASESSGFGKRTEQSKPADATTRDKATKPDAATAGAD
jgi:cytoskeletal protein CcmA (bactofilin family)